MLSSWNFTFHHLIFSSNSNFNFNFNFNFYISLSLPQANRDKLEAEVEQFYADDPGKTRELFLDTVKKLKKMQGSDWFMVRNYDQPPPVLATLFSAVCTLMLVRDSWKSARNLVGSSVQNMEARKSKNDMIE